jgi:apolipoprotein N-acyltransferase
MEVEPLDDAREQAVAYLKRKRKFYVDLASYVAVNGMLWVIWALSHGSGDTGFPWPLWPMAIWGVFLTMDALRVYGPWAHRMHAPITDAEIQREIDRSAHHV